MALWIRRICLVWGILAGIALMPGFSCEGMAAALIEEVEPTGENRFSCTCGGVKHGVILDLPETADGAPLVLMLHGYGGSAESFRRDVRFEEPANERGYAVAYVTGAPDPNDPASANGWNSGLGIEGNEDTEFLVSLADYLINACSLDENRIYAVGFSNGAFMIHRLAMEAGGTFRACVSVAGFMPESVWNSRNAGNQISFFQVTGEKDDVVPKESDGSAAYAGAPSIETVMEYWAESNGLKSGETTEVGKGSLLTRYSEEDRQAQVWHLSVKDGRHSWPDKKISGIDMNAMILDFFGSLP